MADNGHGMNDTLFPTHTGVAHSERVFIPTGIDLMQKECGNPFCVADCGELIIGIRK